MAACTDQQFIALWQKLQSPSLVAKALGQMDRSVMSRRRSIEQRYKILLPMMATTPQNAHKNTAAIEPNRAVVNLSIKDGVVLIASDIHIWPGPRTTMQRAFVEFAKKLKPFAIILNGDVFDGARVSRFGDSSWVDMEKKPGVKRELEAVSDFLDDVRKASPSSKRLWPMGNHDARFERSLVANNPEYAGVQGTRLKDHFPAWIPCWRVDINDDIVVRHRELGGEHADYRNVVTSGVTMITGHDHRANVTAYHNYKGTKWGVRCGYMADSPSDPQFVDYLENRVPNWCPAFVLLTFVGGALLWPELVTKFNDGKVNFRGALIDA